MLQNLNLLLLLNLGLINILQMSTSVQACGPGRSHFKRSRLRKMRPLVQHECVPNVSENTLAASGRPDGPIRRDSKRFRELVQNWNPDIVFRDDEGTGADRMMTQRLKERLSILAIIVMNQWPHLRLRVIEGWDEDRRHAANSLHYEGRAVDITTSDRDKSKYGMLARLAVEAGFDWVHYESRSHVHCSVKSERADMIRNNGCFDGESRVRTPDGEMEMSQLQLNDLVLTMNPQTGVLQYNPIIMFLDKDEVAEETFVRLRTKSGRAITLTPSHLIYVSDEPPDDLNKSSNEIQSVDENHIINPRAADNQPNSILLRPKQAKRNSNPDTTNMVTSNGDQQTIDYGAPASSDAQSGNNNTQYYYYDVKESMNHKKASQIYAIAKDGPELDGKLHSTNKEQIILRIDNKKTLKSTANKDSNPNNLFVSNNRNSDKINPKYHPQAISETNNQHSGLQANDQLFRPTREISVDNIAYTTFARDAFVGQYLLIHVSPEEQLEEISRSRNTTRNNKRHDSDLRQEDVVSPYKGTTLYDGWLWKMLANKDYVRSSSRLTFKTELDRVQETAKSLDIEVSPVQSIVRFDQIVSVEYITSRGIYAPLTREGNIVVNSVVASCYAMVRNHDMAHMAFAPYRLYTYLPEWLYGLRTSTPTRDRTITSNKSIRKNSMNNDHNLNQDISFDTNPKRQDLAKTRSNGATKREIHWYPALLYKIARYILPNNNLF